jgi:hypothetical protein
MLFETVKTINGNREIRRLKTSVMIKDTILQTLLRELHPLSLQIPLSDQCLKLSSLRISCR